MECDQVLVQVLRKESLTSLNNVFSIVRAEEVIRSIMLDILASEGSTFAILSSKSSLIPSTNFGRDVFERPSNRDNL